MRRPSQKEKMKGTSSAKNDETELALKKIELLRGSDHGNPFFNKNNGVLIIVAVQNLAYVVSTHS
jgi:hypothetical protein